MSDKKEDKRSYGNNFVDLKELVYAPLHAVAESNMRLSTGLVELIASAGEVNPADKEGTIHLKTIDIAYQQISNDGNHSKLIEEVGVKLPLLSVLPLSSLQVQKSKVSFDTEIKRMRKDRKEDKYVLEGRVCAGAKHRRKDDAVPKVKFEVELESTCMPEGLARFIDILNVNPIPETISTKQVNENGQITVGENCMYFQRKKAIRAREARLNNAAEKLEGLITRKKLIFQSLLREGTNQTGTFDTLFTNSNEDQNLKLLEQLAGKCPEENDLTRLYHQIAELTSSLKELRIKALDAADDLVMLELERVKEDCNGEC